MAEPPVAVGRATGRRFVRSVLRFLTSEVRWRARLLFGLLLFFALAVNALNVLNSYVNRDFMTAIAHRDFGEFARQAGFYIGVFAASTAVASFYRFTEERLGLLWRKWQTKSITQAYMQNQTYFRLQTEDGVENPDQRIADDVRAFTQTSLSFMLISLNGLLAVISFSGVLWMISPALFGVAVVYAALGTAGAVLLGRPLVGLNVKQSDAEAAFRADLVHVREYAEPIALLRREDRLTARLLRRIETLVHNARRIITVNRNLSFFTNGYNYMIQIIPALIVAPLFIRGEVEFGVITQSAVAFTQLVGAFSIVVTQIQSISAFAAVIARLSALAEGVERTEEPLEATTTADAVTFQDVSIFGRDRTPLVNQLTVSFRPGSRALVTAQNEDTLVALLRVTAGLARPESGCVMRPRTDDIVFLPQRPYQQRGPLREVLVRTARESTTSDADIESVLAGVGLESWIQRLGGLDADRDWAAEFSLREQQLLAVARVVLAKPRFVVLDRLGGVLGQDGLHSTLCQLANHGIGYVALGESPDASDNWTEVLQICADGSWTLS